MRGSARVDCNSLATRGNNMENNMETNIPEQPVVESPEGTTIQIAKPTKRKAVRVTSLEEVDLMTDEEVIKARLAGASKKKVRDLVGKGQDYIEAKRSVIKANLTKVLGRQKDNPPKSKEKAEQKLEMATQKSTKKRQRSDHSTPPAEAKKRPRKSEMTFTQALCSAKVAVVCDGFPGVRMEPTKLKAVQTSILEALERTPEEGPQIRLLKSTFKPGYLVMTCADSASAQWLRDTTPTLKPWEGASLQAKDESEVERPCSCTVYIPDEDGKRLGAESVLTRLRVSNRKLNTRIWTVLGKTPAEKGQVWVLSMDKESFEELNKLQMCPYFGIGRIKFRVKDDGYIKKVAEAGPSGLQGVTAATSAVKAKQKRKEVKLSEGQSSKAAPKKVNTSTKHKARPKDDKSREGAKEGIIPKEVRTDLQGSATNPPRRLEATERVAAPMEGVEDTGKPES
ncbi:uncharacterized protein [Diabrotica undecimpunctata]|uniref:uncharacterized protein n=1 Tax=Diabrotica undecimpunctata TaxID=50387 RepID=UPI003B63569C